MRHHAEMMSVLRAERRDSILRPVRIIGIVLAVVSLIIDISHGDASLVEGLLLDRLVGPIALSFSVRNPHSQRAALHAPRENRVRLLDLHVHEAAFQFSRLVLNEARLFGAVRDPEGHIVDLAHELAPVADAQTEPVFLLDEPLELLPDHVVEQNARRPSARALQHVLRLSSVLRALRRS